MMRLRSIFILLPIFAMFLVGASCSHGTRNDAQSHPAAATSVPSGRVDHVDGVDVSQLSTTEKRLWTDLINDLLSPCGEPISVGRCAADTHCHSCGPAARYLSRLVMEGFERSEIEERFHARYSADGAKQINVEGAPVRGALMGTVTVVEFSDFECPFCGAAAPVVDRLLRQFDGKVKLIFKSYPLDMHPRAMPAARAAAAANKQGKFWEMYDLLFSHQHDLEDEDIDHYAEQIHLDMARFHADIASPELQARVDADKAEGRRLGVSGTPTFFVNGRQFKDNPQALEAYLREELEQ